MPQEDSTTTLPDGTDRVALRRAAHEVTARHLDAEILKHLCLPEALKFVAVDMFLAKRCESEDAAIVRRALLAIRSYGMIC